MTRLRTVVLTAFGFLIAAPVARAQLSTVVVVDFEKAVEQCQEGKKASEKFNTTMQARQSAVQAKQKELEDQQKKLENGARTLSDSAKADIQKDIERRTTELQRMNEDAQKDLQELRDQLLRPIAVRVTNALQELATEKGYTVVVDISNPESNVVWHSPKNDITDELIKRVDAATPQNAGQTPAPQAAGPAANTAKPQ